jgi:hypothetical protein
MNIIESETSPFSLDESGNLVPKGEIHPSAWINFHRDMMRVRKHSKSWFKQSREYGIEQYGIEFVAESEVQLELSLGIEPKDQPPRLNPDDKTKAIVTIEGISQKFTLWGRRMEPEIETWEKDRLTKLRELLRPMIELNAKIEKRLEI